MEALSAEVRAIWPNATIWTIGDAAHRATASDHNPTGLGVVTAIDIMDFGGVKIKRIARRVKKSKHPALKYCITNRRIFSVKYADQGWRPYTGSNPHTSHVHVSVGVGPDGWSTGPYDDTSPWRIKRRKRRRVLREGDKGRAVKRLQRRLNKDDPGPRDLGVDGRFGPLTAKRVRQAQHRHHLVVDGVVGPLTWKALS
ncbi:MAG: peptidoglycan-binding domain-containing protein [Candidatus Nanopelagicales bacterium]|nr:peptidoglycan-binding domain-containing protein [Candidatus Nanopelagicales bacterium]